MIPIVEMNCLIILLFNALHVKKFAHINFSQSSDLEFEYLSKSENMQWVCNICKEQSKPIYSDIEAKLDLLKMMPKINDFEDRIEHFENALTASNCKI